MLWIEYIKEILDGIKYLHQQNLVHRDIKPSNLLINANNVIKIADFGVCGKIQKNKQKQVGTPLYIAPEVRTNKQTKKHNHA